MPIYAYACRDCGAEEEHIQKMGAPPPAPCESCGGVLERQMSAAMFVLKGGGWYADGYASAEPAKRANTGGGEVNGSKAATGTTGSSTTSAKPDKASKPAGRSEARQVG